MNFAEIKDEIAHELQFDVNTGAQQANSYRDNVARIVNSIYLELMAAHPWRFLQMKEDFLVYETVTGTCRPTNNSFLIDALSVPPIEGWVGHTFICEDNEYEITDVNIPAAQLSIRPIYSTGGGAGTAFSIEFRRYALPVDSAQTLGFMSRSDDDGEVFAISNANEKNLVLNYDDFGRPVAFLQEPERTERAPRVPMVGVPYIPGAPGLPNSTAYRYFYTYYVAGRESGRSNIVEVTTAAAGNTGVLLTNIEASAGNTGIKKLLYREDRRDGIFRLLDVLDETDVNYQDNDSPAPDEDEVFYDKNGRHYVRFWPVPDEDYTFELRFQRQPRRLQHDTDVPEFPAQFHILLVHGAVMRLAATHEGTTLTRFHDKKYQEILRHMRRKEISTTAERWQRAYWRSSSRNVLQPTITLLT